jgi:hypothetical protein
LFLPRQIGGNGVGVIEVNASLADYELNGTRAARSLQLGTADEIAEARILADLFFGHTFLKAGERGGHLCAAFSMVSNCQDNEGCEVGRIMTILPDQILRRSLQ